MGYYTTFELEIHEKPEDFDVDKLDLFMMKQKRKDNDFMYPFSCVDGEFEDDHGATKWYQCDKELPILSKAFPEVVFKLSGEGEESGDIWTTYYKGGKSQSAKVVITVEEYDEKKLK